MSRGLTKQGATVNLGTPLLIERLPEARKAKMRGESLSGGGKLTGCV